MRTTARLALAAAGTGLAALTASILPFIRPATGEPVRADAVFVLSGDHGERLATAMRLLEQGVTSTLVLDGTPDSVRAVALCGGGEPFEVVCLRPDPDSTRQEARAAGRLAAERRWTSVVVSTSTFHATRSKLLFERCLEAEVVAVAGDPPYGGLRLARAVAREWLAVAHLTTLARGC